MTQTLTMSRENLGPSQRGCSDPLQARRRQTLPTLPRSRVDGSSGDLGQGRGQLQFGGQALNYAAFQARVRAHARGDSCLFPSAVACTTGYMVAT